MADAPSRAVVIFGDGFMAHVGSRHSNLHSFASDGCCGFLALRSPDADGDRGSLALIQLLDLYDAYKGNESFQSISARFMGMKAAMMTNSEQAGAIGRKSGLDVAVMQDFGKHESMSAEAMASKLLDMVGVRDPAKEKKPFDLLFLHLVADYEPGLSSEEATDWIDSLVGKLKSATENHILLVLILGYGDAPPEVKISEDLPSGDELLKLRPRQSYTMKGGKPVEDIRSECSLLAVYHQKAVTRRDRCACLELEEFRQKSGNLTILADRFLHEVAFKLWKAPKYGA